MVLTHKSPQQSALKFISVSAVHCENASPFIVVTPLGMVKLSSAVQYLNALGPIVFKVCGNVTLFNLPQLLKAPEPIDLTPSGTSICSMSTPAKAFAAIVFTLPSAGIILSLKPYIRFFFLISIRQLPAVR